jgi:flagellar biosynthetic protein FlhB
MITPSPLDPWSCRDLRPSHRKPKSGQLTAAVFPFDLQLFAGEKTEPATDRRREEARKQGNVLKSQDLSSAIILFTAFLVLRYYGPDLLGILADFMRYHLEHAMQMEITLPVAISLMANFTTVFFKALAPIFIIIVFTALLTNYYQVGFLLSVDPLIPDLNRLNPISGLENVFSWKAVGELVKSIAKVLIISWIPYSTLSVYMPTLVRFVQLEPMSAMVILGNILFTMIFKILGLLLALAIGDWFFQSWRYEENLKMSKEEIKEEYKQREGDPKVKAKIRERQRKLATRQMMAEVPKATVVVTNPTHIAVALAWEQQSASAPKVVAMGTGLIAQRIKEIAKEHGVPVIENKPLARALNEMVDVGDEIPEDLYLAVAEILAQVMGMKKAAA